MARYVDAEKVIEVIINTPSLVASKQNLDYKVLTALADREHEVIDLINNNVQTEDVAPVVHARFKPYPENIFREGQNMKCTNCGELFNVEYLNYLFWDYCPNCGAIMDGEDTQETHKEV